MTDVGDDGRKEDGDDGGEGRKQEEVIGYMTLASFYGIVNLRYIR